MEELLARIRAALRRTSSAEPVPTYKSNDLEIDFERRKVLVQGHSVRLTPKEFDLLRHLVASQGKPLEHCSRICLQAVWGPDYGNETEYLRVFINQLRKKIEPDPARPKYIHTDPWVGYRSSQSTLCLRNKKGNEVPKQGGSPQKVSVWFSEQNMLQPVFLTSAKLIRAKIKITQAESQCCST